MVIKRSTDNQVDYQPIERVIAVLISQLKKKIFTSCVLVKPVVMFKSKTTMESAELKRLL